MHNELAKTTKLAAVETMADLYEQDPLGKFTHRQTVQLPPAKEDAMRSAYMFAGACLWVESLCILATSAGFGLYALCVTAGCVCCYIGTKR